MSGALQVSAALATAVRARGWDRRPVPEWNSEAAPGTSLPCPGATATIIDFAVRMGRSRRHRELDAIGIDVAQARTKGKIDDAEFAALSECAVRRHSEVRWNGRMHDIRYGVPRKPNYDKAKSKNRRRGLVRLGLVPDWIADDLTPGEESVATVIFQDMAATGRCEKSNGEIAQLAGCCERLVIRTKKKLAEFAELQLIERKNHGRRHDTTIINLAYKGGLLDRWLRDLPWPPKPTLGERRVCVHHSSYFSEANRGAKTPQEAIREGRWRPPDP